MLDTQNTQVNLLIWQLWSWIEQTK